MRDERDEHAAAQPVCAAKSLMPNRRSQPDPYRDYKVYEPRLPSDPPAWQQLLAVVALAAFILAGMIAFVALVAVAVRVARAFGWLP